MAIRFGSDVLPSERRPVAWYSPPVLLQAARELLSSEDFQRNLDRRENYTGTLEVIDLADAFDGGECGFDFLSDTGDGGNATYAVASAATADALTTDDGRTFKRPPLVVLGGDLAYPTASSLDYHYRFFELFTLAAPGGAAGRPKAWEHVLAIPQNHDWFDSATTFSRYFVGRAGERDFVDANAQQERTYFAARLPHGWWILGLDLALRGDIDRNQFEAFRSLWAPDRVGPRIQPGDNLILLYPKPYWTEPLSFETPRGYTRRFQRLEHLLEAPPAPAGAPYDGDSAGAGARVRLRLAGDLHHYSRRTAEVAPQADAQPFTSALVTCGSAGAFMHTTHGAEVRGAVVMDRSPAEHTVPPSLGEQVRVGLPDGCESDHTTRYSAPELYPSCGRSRWMATWRLPGALLWPRLRHPHGFRELLAQLWNSNLGFVLLLGLLYVANANVNALLLDRASPAQPGLPQPHPGISIELALRWLRAMFSSPLAALFNFGMITGCVRLGWEGTWPRGAKLAAGVLHGMAQGFVVFLAYVAASRCAQADWAASLPTLVNSALLWTLVGFIGGVAGALLFGCFYAVLSAGFGQITNNASSAIAVEHYKGFLRFTLDATGLRMRMFGCDRVPKQWVRDAAGAPQPKAGPACWREVDRLDLPR